MTRTTIVRPPDVGLHAALRLALAFAAATFAFHIVSALWQAHIGYGYFRDEFYYIMCGRRLAWGYVDHGPIVALQARFAEAIFGTSLTGIRALSGLGGALRVALTGVLCWSLGGRRPAQGLAMLAIGTAPIYLAVDGFLSMNSWESAFWMPCVLALVLLLRGAHAGLWWTVLGVSAGLGLLNKPSILFFLVAVGVALLLRPQRTILFTRYAAFGIALMILISSPNILWQVLHHWPTLEFLHNVRVLHKNITLAPLAFLANQLVVLGPWTAFVYLPGLVYLLRNRERRWLGIAFLLFLVAMIVFGAKDYYVTSIYPVLFAAGGLACERRFAQRRRLQQGRAFAFPVAAVTMLLFTLVILPTHNPVPRPAAYLRYAAALHLPSIDTENEAPAILPQFYADRFGWQEEADSVRQIVAALPPQDRSQVGILTSNYGEAAALEFLASGLPPVLSGHNNYWLWGDHGITGKVMIVLSGDTPAHFQSLCDRVEIAGTMHHPLSMGYERRNIYLLHGCHRAPADHWIDFKKYI